MEDLTQLFIIMSICLFVVRYFVKKSGTDFLSAIFSLCTTIMIFQDGTIPDNQRLVVFMPVFLILMLSFVRLMFSKKGDSY